MLFYFFLYFSFPLTKVCYQMNKFTGLDKIFFVTDDTDSVSSLSEAFPKFKSDSSICLSSFLCRHIPLPDPRLLYLFQSHFHSLGCGTFLLLQGLSQAAQDHRCVQMFTSVGNNSQTYKTSKETWKN